MTVLKLFLASLVTSQQQNQTLTNYQKEICIRDLYGIIYNIVRGIQLFDKQNGYIAWYFINL